nr:putative nuclease HARBI1 [Dermacentor andersoni]
MNSTTCRKAGMCPQMYKCNPTWHHSATKVVCAPLFTSWPSPNELAEVQTNFYNLGGFPCVVGAIDGTHIRIQAPEEAHVNRHFYHSINVQLVVDANGLILDVVAKWSGGTHSTRMLTGSSLAICFDRGMHSGLLLGYSEYQCRPWLMTPFQTPDTRGRRCYNAAHGTTRAVFERYIGQLKRRFHCLHAELRMAPDQCPAIIDAYCTMWQNITHAAVLKHASCLQRLGLCQTMEPRMAMPSAVPWYNSISLTQCAKATQVMANIKEPEDSI